ncbi:unnamed protein product [Schistosoma guineensis]|nr:unnamed protein product [Schistosoma guineensis]
MRCPSSQISLNGTWSIFAVACMPDFSASAGTLSGPAVLLLMICLVAMLISSIVGEVTGMGRFVGAAPMSDGFSGAGLLKSSSVFYSPVPLFLNLSDWLAFFVLDRSL